MFKQIKKVKALLKVPSFSLGKAPKMPMMPSMTGKGHTPRANIHKIPKIKANIPKTKISHTTILSKIHVGKALKY